MEQFQPLAQKLTQYLSCRKDSEEVFTESLAIAKAEIYDRKICLLIPRWGLRASIVMVLVISVCLLTTWCCLRRLY